MIAEQFDWIVPSPRFLGEFDRFRWLQKST